MKKIILPLLFIATTALGQSKLRPSIDQKAQGVEAKVIEWRRDFHQHPELGNQEVRTAKIVAEVADLWFHSVTLPDWAPWPPDTRIQLPSS